MEDMPMEWETEVDWRDTVPLLPVITVEGNLVWLKKCQVRTLKSWTGDRRKQFRSLPVSAIWPS